MHTRSTSPGSITARSCRCSARRRSASSAASGTEVWDTDGKHYLDFLSGIAVVSLGHANPVIAEAIARQAHTLLHVSNFFTNPQATAAAVKVNELLLDATGHDGQIFFTNSGAEANECAIKLARKFGGRGRHTVVSALGSFHGRTLATLAATGQPAKHEPFAPMPEGFRHVAWGDLDAHPGRCRRQRRRRPDRAAPGRGRGDPGSGRLPARYPPAVRRGRSADDGRRDPDRVRAHRHVVRVRATRCGPRRGHARQGDRQRHAGRGVLGAARRGGGVPARRPRQHVQRHGARHGSGQRRRRRDAPHRRTRSGAPARRPLHRAVGRDPGGRLGPWVGPPARRPTDRRPRRAHRLQGSCSDVG